VSDKASREHAEFVFERLKLRADDHIRRGVKNDGVKIVYFEKTRGLKTLMRFCVSLSKGQRSLASRPYPCIAQRKNGC